MIRADLVLEGGLFKSCSIRGHAGAGPKGGDIVCAAVSVLSRTAYKVLSDRKGVTVRSEAPNRGEFFLEASGDGSRENRDFLDGAGVFLKEGLLSVSREFPEFCEVNIVNAEE